MSIVNYLGCNFTLPLSPDDSDDQILIGDCHSDEEHRINVKKHFTTKNVYEVHHGTGMWFNKHYKKDYPKSNAESQMSFLALCKLLDSYLKDGEYCELYTCWVGDEQEERNSEYDQTVNLNDFDINKIQLYEKTLLTIKK
ncbi:hypothetical protein [Metabacillus idriensis]|uniref:hypothetical protein n=1 Tax=Metabacillus idriensis TaxID=324768 RepID=UPI00174BCA7E|nr:hypothetical protein [Metabacillus idriensis]